MQFAQTLRQRIPGAQRIQNNTRVNDAIAVLDTTRVRFLLIGAVVVLSLAYIWLVNSSATAGFELSDLEGRVAELNSEYRGLEIEKSELESLAHIRNQQAERGMVASGSVQYAQDTAVALGNE